MVVYLETPVDLLFDRLKADKKRPLVRSSLDLRSRLLELYEHRHSLYLEVADRRVDCQYNDLKRTVAQLKRIAAEYSAG